MQPAIRTQTDGLNEVYSWETALDCGKDDLPDTTRQEFKDETDVNKVLARYGVNALQRQPEYGEVDYNRDLQQSLDAIREAQRSLDKLPPDLRKKFSTWKRLLDGANNGDLQEDLKTYYEAQKQEKDDAAKKALDTANAAT